MCDPTGGILTAGALMAGSFAANTAIADRQAREMNKIMEGQTKLAEAQSKRAQELMSADAIKPKRARPEEALYGKPDQAGSTTLTGPQGSELAMGQLGKSTLLGG
jgi:hypothetical protein